MSTVPCCWILRCGPVKMRGDIFLVILSQNCQKPVKIVDVSSEECSEQLPWAVMKCKPTVSP